ncbi:MAG: tetratricopeptide repeat protein, partial [Candidatus Hodarchaeales archaeon]
MTKQLSKELKKARELIDQAKLDETLGIIGNFENRESLSLEDQVSALLIKGRVNLYKQRTRKALHIYEIAYQMSQDLGLLNETVSALIGKAYIGFIGDRDRAFSYVSDAEERLDSLVKDPSTLVLKRNLLFIKSWILYLKGNVNEAIELAEECLRLTDEERQGNKLDLAATFLLLGWINFSQGNRTQALDYTIKSLECNKELNLAVAIADCYSLMGTTHLFEGDYDEALQHCKQSLLIKEITGNCRLNVLRDLAVIYYYKSEMNKVLKYRQQAVALAEELNITGPLILALNDLGFCYRVIGKISLAKESFKRALILSEKGSFFFEMARSLMGLIWLYIGEDSRED